MKVGDYVRLNNSVYDIEVINKIAKIYEDTILTENDGSIYYGEYAKEEILKVSPNIIDLIKVGDYVNGYKITMIENKYYDFATDSVKKMQNKEKIKIILGNEEQFYGVYAKDIKSILTKEQFKSMEYKIGE